MTTFGKLFSAFKSAAEDFVEVVAPTTKLPLDHFKAQWTQITDYVFFVDQTGESTPVENTDIPARFNQMIKLLVEEEEEVGNMGPCLEHLLRFGILGLAVQLGKGNYPPGMMREVLRFHTAILTKISQQLIPQVKVYEQLRALIKFCLARIGKDEEDDLQFVEFLCAVCGKIHEYSEMMQGDTSNNSLLDVFVDRDADEATGSRSGTPTIEPKPKPASGCLLLSSLMRLALLENEEISYLAREAMLVCFRSSSVLVTTVIISNTDVCEQLADQLMRQYAALPLTTEDAQAGTLKRIVKWSNSEADNWRSQQRHKRQHLPPDTQTLLEYMSWLTFCNELCDNSPQILSEALTRTMLERFLIPAVAPRLLQKAEAVSIMATSIITASVHQLSSTGMVDAFAQFLLDDSQEEGSKEDKQNVASVLIDRCDDMSDDVSAGTLRLLLETLKTHNEKVLHYFILKHIKELPSAREVDDIGSATDLVDKFMGFVPDALKSCKPESEDYDSSCRDHFVDAQAAVLHCSRACSVWTGPGAMKSHQSSRTSSPVKGITKSVTEEEPAAPTVSVSKVYECTGKLVHVLVRRFSRMLSQPHRINLLVTGIFSTLLHFPHEDIQEALLGCGGNDSLLTTLVKLSSDLQIKAAKIENAAPCIEEMRSIMIGGSQLNLSGVKHCEFLRAVVVIEEFCKELAAIVLVKANVRMLSS